jgi:hypothetical protein
MVYSALFRHAHGTRFGSHFIKNGRQNNTRITRNGEKIQYTFEWGKGTGQRVASGIFTFAIRPMPYNDSTIEKPFVCWR